MASFHEASIAFLAAWRFCVPGTSEDGKCWRRWWVRTPAEPHLWGGGYSCSLEGLEGEACVWTRPTHTHTHISFALLRSDVVALFSDVRLAADVMKVLFLPALASLPLCCFFCLPASWWVFLSSRYSVALSHVHIILHLLQLMDAFVTSCAPAASA